MNVKTAASRCVTRENNVKWGRHQLNVEAIFSACKGTVIVTRPFPETRRPCLAGQTLLILSVVAGVTLHSNAWWCSGAAEKEKKQTNKRYLDQDFNFRPPAVNRTVTRTCTFTSSKSIKAELVAPVYFSLSQPAVAGTGTTASVMLGYRSRASWHPVVILTLCVFLGRVSILIANTNTRPSMIYPNYKTSTPTGN